MNFAGKLTNAVEKNNSLLCIGLDPDPALLPEKISVAEFTKEIIAATADLACAYKLNFAFFEALGDAGMSVLQNTVKQIPSHVLTIGDAKRGDIGNTAKAYAKAIFENLGFDATTVNPYMGFDSVEPFLRYADKGVFILCRTSNPGATDFQSLQLETQSGKRSLFEIVAEKASQWNKNKNIGLVIGATYPEELKLIRQNHPDLPILIPGVGAQGGDLALAVRYGMDKQGSSAIINSSRQIIYASKGKDFAAAAHQAAVNLRQEINKYRGI